MTLLVFALVGLQEREPDITLQVGRSMVLREDRPTRRIAIGNAEIIDVSVTGENEILINAQKAGRTNFLVWNDLGAIRERVVHVEHDLSGLRESLRVIDPSLTAETAADGQSILLRGTVEDQVALDAAFDAAERMFGPQPALRAKEGLTPPLPPGTPPVAQPAGQPALRIVSLIRPRIAVTTLEQRLMDAIKPLGGDVRVRRVSFGIFPDDAKDTFVLEGTVPNQAIYGRVLAILDAFLGSPPGEFRVMTNEGGGLLTAGAVPGAQAAAPGAQPAPAASPGTAGVVPGGTGAVAGVGSFPRAFGSTAGVGQLPPSNIASNFGRATGVVAKNGRWISFVRVQTIPQVQATIRLLEIDRQGLKRLGLDPNGVLAATGVNNVFEIVGKIADNTLTVTTDIVALDAVLGFLERNGLIRSLSEPNLLATAGEVAHFVVGGDVPIQTTTATQTAALGGVLFREFGIRLTMRASVGEDGRTITLELAPEISEPAATDPALSQAGAPSFRRTALHSITQLKDGEGLVLSGLVSMQESETRRQIPLLGDVPLLGYLFGQTSKETRQREIAIVVLPRVVFPRPAGAFALEPPPADFPVRGGVFHDPELGVLETVPGFFYKNVAEGERR